MSVISISITESEERIISGIPKSVIIEANIPSTIFYTFDGSDPILSSDIYLSILQFPTDRLSVTLKVFATNGIDSSPILTFNYGTVITNSNTRLPHAAVSDLGNSKKINSLFPFGTNSPNPIYSYSNNANAGVTVDSQTITGSKFGFDANGNPVGETDKDINSYTNVYTVSNFSSNLPSVGIIPQSSTIGKATPVEYTQQSSNTNDLFFNPKASVIFQDADVKDPTKPPIINRQYFSFENQEIVKDGVLLQNTAMDSPTTTGSYLRSHYNPRTNLMTHYYFDSSVNKWIISESILQKNNMGELYHMYFPRVSAGAGVVFKWLPFRYRTLT